MVDRENLVREALANLGYASDSNVVLCPECGAHVPDVPDGPTHAYLGGLPGCWLLYSAMLAREFAGFDPEVHRLSVDSYAVQHAGVPGPQTTQSLCVHLVALCLTFEHGWSTNRIRNVMGDLSKGRYFNPVWLEPPTHTYSITVLDLVDAETPEMYGQRVRTWAQATWAAWAPHQQQIGQWANQVVSAQDG